MKHNDNEIYQKLALFKKEVESILRENGTSAVGLTAKDAAEAQRHMIAVLMDKFQAQNRMIAWMLGEKVEPEQHFAEAVIVGIGEGAS